MAGEQINFEVKGMKELLMRLENGDEMARIILNDGLRKIGRVLVPAKGTGPLASATPVRSGKLARSTHFIIDYEGLGKQKLVVLQPARSEEGEIYGEWVREGRGPVRAIRAKALHFFIDGQEFFRKSVGPSKPNPYHKRVLAEVMPKVNQVVKEIGERFAAYIAGK